MMHDAWCGKFRRDWTYTILILAHSTMCSMVFHRYCFLKETSNSRSWILNNWITMVDTQKSDWPDISSHLVWQLNSCCPFLWSFAGVPPPDPLGDKLPNTVSIIVETSFANAACVHTHKEPYFFKWCQDRLYPLISNMKYIFIAHYSA